MTCRDCADKYRFEPESRLEGYYGATAPKMVFEPMDITTRFSPATPPVIEVSGANWFTPPPLVQAEGDPSEWLSYVPRKTPWLLLAGLAGLAVYAINYKPRRRSRR